MSQYITNEVKIRPLGVCHESHEEAASPAIAMEGCKLQATLPMCKPDHKYEASKR